MTSRLLKRTIDLIVVVVTLPIALLTIVVCAAISAACLRAWPFFGQQRLGLEERPFRIWKIRTLPPHSPAYALKNGHRLHGTPTRATNFMRRTKLDEFPQILNVLRGELSLVGPRPKMPHEFEPVGAAYARARTSVPQGCTGLWQVSIWSHALPSAHPEFDEAYVSRAGTRMDLWILWRTLLLAARIGRRITVDDIPSWVTSPSTAPASAELTNRPASSSGPAPAWETDIARAD